MAPESLKTLAEKTFAYLREVYGYDAGAIFLLDDDRQTLRLAESCGLSDALRQRITALRTGEGLAGRAIRENRLLAYHREDYPDPSLRPFVEQEGFQLVVALPLALEDRPLGALALASRHKFTPSLRDLETLTHLSRLLAHAIENARLLRLLSQAKREWEETFDAISDGVAIIDPNNIVVRVNQAFADRLHLPSHSIVGKRCHEVFHGTPEHWQECPHHVTKETGLPARAQVREPLDGRDYDIVTTPIKSEDGTITGHIHVSRDMTEQIVLKDHLFQTEKLAALGQLLAGVAHELNNPLTTVLGFSQLLLEKPGLDPAARDSIQRVVEAADRTRRIVSSFLTFSRHHQPEKRLVDLNALLEETLALQEYEMRVHNIQIRKELDPRLPQARVDPHQIQQVFLNLFLNAYQAMLEAHQKGTLTVRTALKSPERLPHGAYIEIAIADDGPGISPDQIHKVFDPFFTTKDVGKGTGLGLSIAYGIVREHGGNLYAKSHPGEGTTMFIELPVLRGADPLQQEKETPPAQPFRARILVVEDEEAIARLIQTALRARDHQVEIADSGETAWDLLCRSTYDLILTDIKMPGQGGKAFFVKAQEAYPNLAKRFLFVTGDIASPQTESFLSQAGCRHLAKPFNVDDLYRAVEEMLQAP